MYIYGSYRKIETGVSLVWNTVFCQYDTANVARRFRRLNKKDELLA